MENENVITDKGQQHETLPSVVQDVSFSTGEVARMLGVEAHTVRFWEKEFNITVSRKESNRRRYSRSDVTLFKKIQRLSHKEGMSLNSARHQLAEEGAIVLPPVCPAREPAVESVPQGEAAALVPRSAHENGQTGQAGTTLKASLAESASNQDFMQTVHDELCAVALRLRQAAGAAGK